jgi:hypothetical protein
MTEEKKFKQMALFYSGLGAVCSCAASVMQASDSHLADLPPSIRARWKFVTVSLEQLAMDCAKLALKETV